MNYNEAITTISKVDFPKSEWVKRTISTGDAWVYQADQSLCIMIDYADGAYLHLKEFKAPWLANFPPASGNPLQDGSGSRASHYYRVISDSVLENVILVSVDGGPDGIASGHARMPLPGDAHPTRIPLYRYALARIVNDSQANLDWAITTAGFTLGTDNTL
jgi:hypothetical protein